MSRVARVIVVFLALGAATGAMQADPLDIQHQALTCVTAESYVAIHAGVQPASRLASARVEFRSSGASWYSVAMTGPPESLSAVLPRPGAGLDKFSYRLAVEDSSGGRTRTGDYEVRVDSGRCGSAAATSLEPGAPVVVTVPEGAPVVPPVPPGFNPSGAIGATEATGDHPSKLGPIAGVAAVAGGIGAVAGVFGAHASEASGSGPSVPDPSFPLARIDLVGSDPPPGSTIHLSREHLTLNLRIDSLQLVEPERRSVQVLLRNAVGFSLCLRLTGFFTASGTPQEVAIGDSYDEFGCRGEYRVGSANVTVLDSSGAILLRTGTGNLPDLSVDYTFLR